MRRFSSGIVDEKACAVRRGRGRFERRRQNPCGCALGFVAGSIVPCMQLHAKWLAAGQVCRKGTAVQVPRCRIVIVQRNLNAFGGKRLVAHEGTLVEDQVSVIAPVKPAVDPLKLCLRNLLKVAVQFKHPAFHPRADMIAAVAPFRRQFFDFVFRHTAAARFGVRMVIASLFAAVYAGKGKSAHTPS